MSHRPPPRPRVKARQAPTGPLSEMVRITEAPPLRWLYDSGNADTGHRRLLSEPGAEYTQLGNASHALPGVLKNYTAAVGGLNVGLQAGRDSSRETVRQSALDKKRRQWSKWVDEVIPMLVEPYLSLLYDTKSLRYEVSSASVIRRPGNCGHASRMLRVVCIHFESASGIVSASMTPLKCYLEGLETIEIDVCLCAPAAMQLLSRGLFPCAPTVPSMAIDLAILQYAQALFLRSPPNVSAWSEAIEACLSKRAYELAGRVCLLYSILLWVTNMLAQRTICDGVLVMLCGGLPHL
jgi:hypothetical protein